MPRLSKAGAKVIAAAGGDPDAFVKSQKKGASKLGKAIKKKNKGGKKRGPKTGKEKAAAEKAAKAAEKAAKAAIVTLPQLWEQMFAKLVAYKKEHGDCKVPKTWYPDPSLGGWVSSQRRFRIKMDNGEPCLRMSPERVARLTKIGFFWEHINVTMEREWETEYARLAAYKATHGDCYVPRAWHEDGPNMEPSKTGGLGTWVVKQRARKRAYEKKGDGTSVGGMTAERVAKLEALAFSDPPVDS